MISGASIGLNSDALNNATNLHLSLREDGRYRVLIDRAVYWHCRI
jgi:hypothetical protein